jgi:divinyl protochlorophyllide a 8-vinyl-reductase
VNAVATGGVAGRIGPNAIIRVAEALEQRVGQRMTAQLFARADLTGHLEHPPTAMVDEGQACRLHALLRSELGQQVGAEVARKAGWATAGYLLAHRIPKPVQGLLKRLPAPWACRVLLAAISRHAWTFVGSGHFDARPGRPTVLTIRHNALCRGQQSDDPVCDYYAATFERLFQVLVHRDARVSEISCEARGDDACRFELRW